MSNNSRKKMMNSRNDERSHSGLRTGRSETKQIEKIKIPKFGKRLSRKDLN